jgi:hypothetical protein
MQHGWLEFVFGSPNLDNKTFALLSAYPMPQKKVEKYYSDILGSLFGLRKMEKDDASFNTLLDELPLCFWMHDENYSIVYANRVVEERFGPCHGRKCYECFMGKSILCRCCVSKSILAGGHDTRCTYCKRSNTAFDINIYHVPLVHEDGKKFIIKCNMHIQDINILFNT